MKVLNNEIIEKNSRKIKICNIQSKIVFIQNKVRSELSEYENKITPSQYKNLITYVFFMIFGIDNPPKEFLGIYGNGKSRLTKKTIDLVNCNYHDSGSEKDIGDEMYHGPKFSSNKLIILIV